MDLPMVASGNGPPLVRFSSTAWAERERFEAVREIYGRTIVRFDADPARDRPFHIEAQICALPGLGLAYLSCFAARSRRTPQHLTSDDLCLNISQSGARKLIQRGREAVIGDGEAVLTIGSEPSTVEIEASRFIGLGLSRKTIAPLVPDIDDCAARPIRRGTPGLPLLMSYAAMLRDMGDLATPELQRAAVTHLYDLAALTLGATRDAAEIAELRGARHRLPVRYVQRLFEAEGTTFTDFVLSRRLARVHRLLGDPRFAARPIATIAAEAGFGDLTHFNRMFRRWYGASPSDIRAAALHRSRT